MAPPHVGLSNELLVYKPCSDHMFGNNMASHLCALLMWTFKLKLLVKTFSWHILATIWFFTCVTPHVDFQVTVTLLQTLYWHILQVYGFSPVWHPHVDIQMASSYKTFTTRLATIWFFTCVTSSCGLSSHHLHWNPLLTYFASIWFLTSVPPHVDFQIASSYKTFTTCLATMWLLTSVRPHVGLSNELLVYKTFLTTCLATMWLLTSVTPHVDLSKSPLQLQNMFTTRLATIWFLTCVHSSCGNSIWELVVQTFSDIFCKYMVSHLCELLMWTSQFITTSKSFPAYFAWIRFLTRVYSQMNRQTILMNKSFSTSVTFERLFTCLSTRVNLWFGRVVHIVTVTPVFMKTLLRVCFFISCWSWIQMFSSVLILALSSRRVVREELVLTVWFSVVTFLTMRSQHEGFSLLLQYELLSLLTGAHFLLFLFNLWRFLFLWVQTGAPLLETELLVSENLLLLTDMLLWELWRNKEAQDRGYNWDVKIKTV